MFVGSKENLKNRFFFFVSITWITSKNSPNYEDGLVVERVAKSRVLDRSDSKKSDSGQVG